MTLPSEDGRRASVRRAPATAATRPSDGELVELAERAADPARSDRYAAAAMLRDRADEVVDAFAAAVDADPPIALRLAAALPMLWQDLGRVEEGRRMTERAVARWPGPPTPGLARALLAAAELAFRQGDQDAAIGRAEEALEIAKATGDAPAAALALVDLARTAYRDGDAGRIESRAQQALDTAPDDVAARRGALHMLAWAAYTRGDLPLAVRRFEASLDLRRSLGDDFGAAVELANLADLAAEAGEIAIAAVRLGEALDVAERFDSTYLVLNLLPSIAAVAHARGRWRDAAVLVGATDALSERTGLVPDPGAWEPPRDELPAARRSAVEVARAAGRRLDRAAAIDRARRVAGEIGADPG